MDLAWPVWVLIGYLSLGFVVAIVFLIRDGFFDLESLGLALLVLLLWPYVVYLDVSTMLDYRRRLRKKPH